MHSCPLCGHSRWVHRRSTGLAHLAQRLTGWSAYACMSCGWRGWLQVNPQPHHRAARHTAESATHESVFDRIQRHPRGLFGFVAGYLTERVRLLQQRTGLSAATWLIIAFACGLVIGAVVFRRGRPVAPVTPPQIAGAPDTRAPTQPTAQVAGVTETPLKPELPSVPPAAVAAAEQPAVNASSAGAPPTSPAPSPPVTARKGVAAEPAARPSRTAQRPSSVKSPRFRGSLAVDSQPRGALVFVDGQMAGATPIVLNNVAAGSRVVRIESDGYVMWSGAARVVADQQTRVSANLQR